MSLNEMEPAERDPKALVRTAWILVGIAILSAVFIPWAYRTFLQKTAQDFRPPYKGIVKKNISLKLLDEKIVKTSELLGQTWVAWLTTVEDLKAKSARQDAIELIPEEVKKLIFILDIGPTDELDAGMLKTYPSQENVWYIRAGAEIIKEYLKGQLKIGILPYQDEEGIWHYDDRLIVAEGIEKPNIGHHLRGTFDFARVRKKDLELEKKEKGSNISHEKYLQEYFLKTLSYLNSLKTKP